MEKCRIERARRFPVRRQWMGDRRRRVLGALRE
jgi:hypothetical protein